MKKENDFVLSRIERKEIRIEKGRLVGLGLPEPELPEGFSIDICSLETLLINYSPEAIADALNNVIYKVGVMVTDLHKSQSKDSKDLFYKSYMPSVKELHVLKSLFDCFNKA